MAKTISHHFVVVTACILLLGSSSCISSRNALYFAGQGDAVIPATELLKDYPIQANDLLSISVSSLNPEATTIFNTPNLASLSYSTASGANSYSSGYLVSSDGYIQFPILGNVKAAGLTKAELKTTITSELMKRKLLVDPIVSIRHLNFKVTVLGEVARPTVITVPSEKITLMEALGLAGDLTVYAKRDNVLIIREEGGQRVTKRINLSTPEIFSSPYYYLKSNDVVYVEPSSAKVSSASNARTWLPVVFSALSFVTIIVTRWHF